jgi:hypothetical protein
MYLGRLVTQDGNAERAIKKRIAYAETTARLIFDKLRHASRRRSFEYSTPRINSAMVFNSESVILLLWV